MRRIDKSGTFSHWQSAAVPGSVYTDLLENHQIQNPYWKDNEDFACALMEDDYEYECFFQSGKTDGYTDIYIWYLKDSIRLQIFILMTGMWDMLKICTVFGNMM